MGGNEIDRREQSFLSILLKSQIFKEWEEMELSNLDWMF